MSVLRAAGLTARDVDARGGGLVGVEPSFYGWAKNVGVKAGLEPESVRIADIYDYADKDGSNGLSIKLPDYLIDPRHRQTVEKVLKYCKTPVTRALEYSIRAIK